MRPQAPAITYQPQDREEFPTYCISSLVALWWVPYELTKTSWWFLLIILHFEKKHLLVNACAWNQLMSQMMNCHSTVYRKPRILEGLIFRPLSHAQRYNKMGQCWRMRGEWEWDCCKLEVGKVMGSTALCISLGGGGWRMQEPWLITWHHSGILVTGGTWKFAACFELIKPLQLELFQPRALRCLSVGTTGIALQLSSSVNQKCSPIIIIFLKQTWYLYLLWWQMWNIL